MSVDWVLGVTGVSYCGNLTLEFSNVYMFGKFISNESFIIQINATTGNFKAGSKLAASSNLDFIFPAFAKTYFGANQIFILT